MSLANNDFNWRLVAAEDIDENQVVTINSAGKAAVSDGSDVVGICPQEIKAGERCPVIRGGTIGGLVGFAAGDRLYGQGNGTLGTTAGGNEVIAVVKSEDAATAVICSGNLDTSL